jgi:hypothetical protein
MKEIRMSKIYLAGPIKGLNWSETNSWRDYMAQRLPSHIQTLSPLRGKESYLSTKEGTGDADKIADSYYEYPLSTPQAVLGRDRWDATRCDILVVNFLGATKVSIGTVMEIAWADLARVPIMLIMEKSGNPHEHTMVTGAITWRVDNLDTAIDLLAKIL